MTEVREVSSCLADRKSKVDAQAFFLVFIAI